jgi:hypothetical protein
MLTKTGYWVKIEGENVTEIWDYRPAHADDTWVEAIEKFPSIADGKEIYDYHTIDMETRPVEILWVKRTLSLSEQQDHNANRLRTVDNIEEESDDVKEKINRIRATTTKTALNALVAEIF